jgi:hypothetical protein
METCQEPVALDWWTFEPVAKGLNCCSRGRCCRATSTRLCMRLKHVYAMDENYAMKKFTAVEILALWN